MTPVPPYLGEFGDEDARWLSRMGFQRQVRAGETVIEEGVMPEHVFVVLEGEFVASSRSLSVPELQRIRPGELLGEMSYINRRPPGGSVRAATDGVLLALRRSDIEAKVAEDPQFGARFNRVLSEFAVTRLWAFGRRDLADAAGGAPPPPIDDTGATRVHELIERLLRGEF